MSRLARVPCSHQSPVQRPTRQIAVVWATAGAATPFVVVALTAGGAGAIGQVLGQVTVSGQTYDVERLPGDIFAGSINGTTLAFSFGGLPSANTVFGRVLQGVRQGFIEGSAGGFLGGVAGALVQDGIWSQDICSGLSRVVDAAITGSLLGGITGGFMSGTLAPFWHLCFAAGTLVSAESGLKPIETIEAGERVWAHNFREAAWQLRPVVRPLAYDYSGDMITIEVAGEKIDTTGHHPFWVKEGEGLLRRPTPEHVPALEPGNDSTPGRWVDARDLRVGDVLFLRSGQLGQVEGLVARSDRLKVYNLHVEELHTYLVGEASVLVHNRQSQMPRERPLGTYTGTRTPDGNGGTFTITDPEVRRAAARPGQAIPDSVSVVYTNRTPDLSPYVWDIGGVRGDVRVDLSTDATVGKNARHRQDLARADERFASILNEQGVLNPDTGVAWTADDIDAFRADFRLTWHHGDFDTTAPYGCTMQLSRKPKRFTRPSWAGHRHG